MQSWRPGLCLQLCFVLFTMLQDTTLDDEDMEESSERPAKAPRLW